MFSDELLKTLAEDRCQSNGPPVIQACYFLFFLNALHKFEHLGCAVVNKS